LQPATLYWVEALDKGDLTNKGPHRDRLRSISAPFSGGVAEVGRTAWRYGGIRYT
jgi:hypothetical protein